MGHLQPVHLGQAGQLPAGQLIHPGPARTASGRCGVRRAGVPQGAHHWNVGGGVLAWRRLGFTSSLRSAVLGCRATQPALSSFVEHSGGGLVFGTPKHAPIHRPSPRRSGHEGQVSPAAQRPASAVTECMRCLSCALAGIAALTVGPTMPWRPMKHRSPVAQPGPQVACTRPHIAPLHYRPANARASHPESSPRSRTKRRRRAGRRGRSPAIGGLHCRV